MLVNSYRAGSPQPREKPAAWTPADVATALWLDASDPETITVDESTNVSGWQDKSGNSRHASQSIPSRRPAYVEAGINDMPTFRFDGVNNLLRVQGGGITNIIRAVGGFSVFAIAKWNAFSGATGQLLHLPTATSGAARAQLGAISSGGNRLYMSGRRVDADSNQAILGAAGAIGTTDPVMQGALFNWAEAMGALYLDGDLHLSDQFHDEGVTSDTEASDTASIGAIQHSTPAAFASVDLSEIVAVQNVASTDLIDRIFGYLAWKWDLVGSLDGNHPYKNQRPTV